MSEVVVQLADVSAMDIDPLSRMKCTRHDCKVEAPAENMHIWRIWQPNRRCWLHAPFCEEHILTCLPVSVLAKG